MLKLLIFFVIFAAGCSGIKTDLQTTEENFNKQIRYEGPKARLSVPVVLCKAKNCSDMVADAVRDLLINELVRTNRFIILERSEGLDQIKKEFLLSNSGLVDLKKAIPAGLLEGVDLIVMGIITAVEPDKTKFFIPVFVPWREGGRQHFTGGIAQFKKTYIQMIVRIIDVKTGRIISSIKGEGEFTRWDVLFGEGAFKEGGAVAGVSVQKTVPVEKAANDLVKKITKEIIKVIPENYYKYR